MEVSFFPPFPSPLSLTLSLSLSLSIFPSLPRTLLFLLYISITTILSLLLSLSAPPPHLPPARARATDSQQVIESELMKKTGMPRLGLPAEDGDDDVNATYVVPKV